MTALTEKIKQHPLMNTLLTLKGSPKTLLLSEPLWGIPFYLIAPFVTLYMQALGINDIQIGIILSVGTAVQVVVSAVGGIVTDKFGRKNTTMMGDVFGWITPCFIWALSGSFWPFLIATAFNSMEQVNQTAWVCFVNEGSESDDQLVNIWKWVLIAGQVSVFFAPIAGILIAKNSVVPVVRVLYIIFAVSMILKVIITYRYTVETKRGIIRKRETKNESFLQMLREYEKLIPATLRRKRSIYILAVLIVTQCTYMITTNFFALYATTNLHMSESMMAIFPIFKAAVMLIFFFAAPKIMDRISLEVPMIIGCLFNVVAMLLLIFCPPGNLPILFAYVFLEAIAFAIIVPRKETLVVFNIEAEERARVLSMLVTVSLLVSIPCGYIAGWLSSLDRQYPFILTLVLFVVMTIVLALGWIKRPSMATSDQPLDK